MIKSEHDTLSLDKIKGRIPFPCCPNKSAIVSKETHGGFSVPCPNCRRFVLFNPDEMTAKVIKACRGASDHFKHAG